MWFKSRRILAALVTATIFFLSVNLCPLGYAKAWSKERVSKSYAHYIMGLIYDREYKIPEARDEYLKALEFDSKSAAIRIRLAADYIKLDDFDKAESELKTALELNPDSFKPRFLLAFFYTSLKKYKEAANQYEEILKKSPRNLDAFASLADLYLIQKKFHEAISVYKRLIEANPDLAFAYLNLGVLYTKVENYTEAEKNLKKAITLSPNYVEGRFTLAQLYHEQEKFDQAIKEYQNILELAPQVADTHRAKVYLFLGLVYSSSEDYTQAIDYYKKSLEIDSASSITHFYLASAYERSGDRDKAVDFLKRAIKLDVNNADALNYLGYMYAEEGRNLDEALELINRALEFEPDNGAYVDSLGWVYYQKGMIDQAQLELEKAIKLLGDDAVIRDHLGDIYCKQGLRDKARLEWEKSLKLDPTQEKVKKKLEQIIDSKQETADKGQPIKDSMADYSDKQIKELESKAKEVRRLIIQMIAKAGSGHPGGSLSSADLITCLYFSVLRHDAKDPADPDRDRFHMSKGHCCPLWYAVLAMHEYFNSEELWNLRNLGSILQGHPDWRTPGVSVPSGSLGQGLSVSVGMTLAARIDKKDYRVYCLLGDGEIQEGQIWEAAMSAAHYHCDNLCAILDHNGFQIDGKVEEVMSIEPLVDKWRSFGWHTILIDGHKIREILAAFDEAKGIKGKPTIIIARTTKGKGVSFMENVVDFHGRAPTPEEAEQALEELE